MNDPGMLLVGGPLGVEGSGGGGGYDDLIVMLFLFFS